MIDEDLGVSGSGERRPSGIRNRSRMEKGKLSKGQRGELYKRIATG